MRIFVLWLLTGLMFGCAEPSAFDISTDSPRPDALGLASRDGTWVDGHGRVFVFVYEVPSDKLICDNWFRGRCTGWRDFGYAFDVLLGRNVANVDRAEEIAWKVLENHCGRQRAALALNVIHATRRIVRFDEGCVLKRDV